MSTYDGTAAAAALGLQLPSRLQQATGTARREHIDRRDITGATVTIERVELGRGWRYEVNAEYLTRDHDGPVQRRDTLWLEDYDTARRLFRIAVDELSGMGTFSGLTDLAKRVGITFSAS